MTALDIQHEAERQQPKLTRAEAMEIGSAIAAGCYQHRTPDALTLLALAVAESSLRRTNINKRTKAAGIMGIAVVHYATWLRPSDVFDIARNIEFGVALFARYLARCGWNTSHALSLYNGRGACRDSSFSRRVLKIRAAMEDNGRKAA